MGLLATKSQASIVISRKFSSLSFLNAHFVGLNAKGYFRIIHTPITQNVNHCNGLPQLEIMPNVSSETLYFVVRPYICPISALYFPCTSPISALYFPCTSPISALYFPCTSPISALYFPCTSPISALYFPCTSPISALYFPCTSPISSPI